tara:strand:+ start:3436 stop:4134 length:699 start_codon:yes stop_codon:yes gene_type:complete
MTAAQMAILRREWRWCNEQIAAFERRFNAGVQREPQQQALDTPVEQPTAENEVAIYLEACGVKRRLIFCQVFEPTGPKMTAEQMVILRREWQWCNEQIAAFERGSVAGVLLETRTEEEVDKYFDARDYVCKVESSEALASTDPRNTPAVLAIIEQDYRKSKAIVEAFEREFVADVQRETQQRALDTPVEQPLANDGSAQAADAPHHDTPGRDGDDAWIDTCACPDGWCRGCQ